MKYSGNTFATSTKKTHCAQKLVRGDPIKWLWRWGADRVLVWDLGQRGPGETGQPGKCDEQDMGK